VFQSQPPALRTFPFYWSGVLFLAQRNNLIICQTSFETYLIILKSLISCQQAKAKELSEFDFSTVNLKEETYLNFSSDDEKDSMTGRRNVHYYQEKACDFFLLAKFGPITFS
jgi:hypothetical protein